MEAPLSDELYLLFRDLLHERSGLNYPLNKRNDLQHGLNMTLQLTGHTTLAALYSAVRDASGPAWDALISQLTIGETYFFRNGTQFDVLRTVIIPDLFERRAPLHGMRIWSAGCATGEEPYSIAMLMHDLLIGHPNWQVSILATDINLNFLQRARTAVYGEWSFRETLPAMRERFFTREENRWRLRPEITRLVSFARLNLAAASYPSIANGTCALDVIFCRNVTIYFNEQTTRRIVERFYNALTPGGWLIVGHAEPQASTYSQFEVHNFPGTVIYRKSLDAPLFGFDALSGTFSAGGNPVIQLSAADQLPATTFTPPAPVCPAMAQAQPAAFKPLPRQPEPLHAPAAVVVDLESVIENGQQAADRGDWTQAEELCRQALDRDPLAVCAHYLLGQIYEQQQRLDEALAAYRRTVYLERNFVPGIIGMANVWRQLTRPTEAEKYFRNALKLLALLPPDRLIDGMAGATAADLTVLVQQQLGAL